MGELVIAVYRPRPGKSKALDAVVRRHVPTLRKLKLATKHPSVVMKADDGVVVELFEWASRSAVSKAHRHPGVLKLWKAFEKCSTFGTLAKLPGAGSPFPHFKAVRVT